MATKNKPKYYLPKEHVLLGWILLGMGSLALGVMLIAECYLVSLITEIINPIFSAIGGLMFLVLGVCLVEHGFNESYIEREYIYEEND